MRENPSRTAFQPNIDAAGGPIAKTAIGARIAGDDGRFWPIDAAHGNCPVNDQTVGPRPSDGLPADGVNAIANQHGIASHSRIHGFLDRVSGSRPIQVRQRRTNAVQRDMKRGCGSGGGGQSGQDNGRHSARTNRLK